MMPNMNGLELCRRMKRDARLSDIPVIFVSALGQEHDEAEGFDAGAVDYITKPISPVVALARVRTHLALRHAWRDLEYRNRSLEDMVRARTREVALTQDVTVQALASLVETRDNETGGHVVRTQHYVRCVATELSRETRFRDRLDARAIEMMFKSAPLHDIGKVGIPDAVLLKPGKLTAEEFEIMKTHTTLGKQALTAAAGATNGTSDFLKCAIDIIGGHHEKWDGAGYPEGLKGEQIPLSARVMAIADVYDALTTERVYKPAMSHAEAKAIIVAGRGKHFDPAVVDAFLRCEAEFIEIAAAHADKPVSRDPAPLARSA